MNKEEFLATLRDRLQGLPQEEVEERVAFYEEMIADRMEEGCPEEAAVAAIGNAEEIAAQIVAETPWITIAKEKLRPKRKRSTGEVLLLLLGAPVWLPLVTVVLSLYLSVWAVIGSLWGCLVAVAVSAVCTLLTGVIFLFLGRRVAGVVLIGAGLICAGLSILLFFECKGATKGLALLTKRFALRAKTGWMKKEAAK